MARFTAGQAVIYSKTRKDGYGFDTFPAIYVGPEQRWGRDWKRVKITMQVDGKTVERYVNPYSLSSVLTQPDQP